MPQKIWRPSTNQYFGTWVLFNQIKREWAGCLIGSERTESGCFLIAVSHFFSLGWLHLLRIHELLSHPGRVIMRLALGHQTHLFTGRIMSAYWYTLTSADGDMRGWAHACFTTLCTIAFVSEAMQCKQMLVNKLEWGLFLQARWKVSRAQHFITGCKCWCKGRLLMFFQAHFNQIYW